MATAVESGRMVSDPITRGVIRKMLPAIADEMSYVLQRSSYNMMIYEVRDYCCAIVDPDGSLLCQNLGGVSHFVADLGVVVKDGVERYGLDGFVKGDGILTNHQRVAGQHLNNMCAYTPVFVHDKLICFAIVRAHWVDVGGQSTGFGGGGRASDPWMEGLQLDQVKLYEGGKIDEKALRIISDNIRFPESSLGDMRAQFAACRLAEERINELVGRYGLDTFRATVQELFDDSEARCRRIIEQIADGEYYAESFIDPNPDERDPLEIKVRVVVKGSDLTIDLTKCSTQRKSPTNARTLAGAYIAYKALTTPEEPVNEGSFRALKVEIQEGNFMMAKFPAPMAGWSGALPTVVDTVLRALAPALPDRIPAAHSGTLGGTIVFVGSDPRSGGRFVTQSIEGSGWGARPYEDGENASVSVCQGDVRNAPIEAMELKWPIIVNSRELRTDSGGVGRYRGGLGLKSQATNLVEGTWQLSRSNRNGCPPWGLAGGGPGAVFETFLDVGGSGPSQVVGSERVAVNPGAVMTVCTPGGGGYGDPLDRPVSAVQGDVVEGYVSLEQAREAYGVEIDPVDLRVDEEKTQLRRAALRATGNGGGGGDNG